jgi:hypothetical protein
MTTYAVIVTSTNICDNVVVWDDTFGPWSPPSDHYTVNIDGQDVGIGYYYDQFTQTWTAPPVVTASFNPSPIFLSQTTTLTWTTENATSVTVAGAASALNGSQDFTPDKIGKFSVTVTATGLAGSTSMTATVNVVATQAELVN